MERLGFDFAHGRLDVSLHPFCGGTPDDVRITTRYDESNFTRALMGVLHETGHALYERGLPHDWRHQPVGDARGMSIHESQSLLVEMQVCRSRDFLEFAAPVLRECFGGSGPAWDADNLHRLYTRVERGFIRVDADEVTYPPMSSCAIGWSAISSPATSISPICRRRGTRRCANCWASPRPTTGSAVSRMSTGMTEPGIFSDLHAWAR